MRVGASPPRALPPEVFTTKLTKNAKKPGNKSEPSGAGRCPDAPRSGG
jgi:hypothetical protein